MDSRRAGASGHNGAANEVAARIDVQAWRTHAVHREMKISPALTRTASSHSWGKALTRPLLLTLAVWLVGMALSLFAWKRNSDAETAVVRSRYERRADEVVRGLGARMQAYEEVLRGASGLFATGVPINRAQWAAFVGHYKVETRLAGVVAIGYAEAVAPTDVAGLEASERADGLPDFKVFPPDAGDTERVAAVYIEPMSLRNRRVLGLDMGSDAIVRSAIEWARDSTQVTLSAPTKLVQEAQGLGGAGTIMFQSVYRPGLPLETVSQRRAALRGYVFSVFRMSGLLAKAMEGQADDLALAIYDGPAASPDALLHAVRIERLGSGAAAPRFDDVWSLEVAGRTWSIRLASLPAFEATYSQSHRWDLLIAGAIVSTLAAALTLILGTLRTRALAMAERWSAAHRDSEAQIRLVMDSTADGILTYSEDGILLDANPAAEQIFALTRAQLKSRNIREYMLGLLELDDPGGVPVEMSGQTREIHYHREDGSERILRAAISRVWVKDLPRYTAVISDVTARAEAERALRRNRDELSRQVAEQTADLRRAKDEAERANRAKSEFLANMSHELRTPMHAILSFSALGRDRIASAPQDRLRGYFERIQSSGQRLLALINDLLDLSKLEAGRTAIMAERRDLVPLIEHCAHELEPLMREKKLGFSLNINTADTFAWIDGEKIVQVLTNLLGNAIKFTPPERDIRVQLEEGVLVDGSATATGALRILVQDSGIGIPEEELECVFDKFTQSSATRTGAGGTGLGLAISREIVLAHGGQVVARNRLSGGAELEVTLPRAAS